MLFTINRAGSDTLEAGIEYFPFGSLMASGGRAGPVPVTGPAPFDADAAEPLLFLAVTRTRSW
jgi:hypothetical protein